VAYFGILAFGSSGEPEGGKLRLLGAWESCPSFQQQLLPQARNATAGLFANCTYVYMSYQGSLWKNVHMPALPKNDELPKHS
jgi:hypothetical protein